MGGAAERLTPEGGGTATGLLGGLAAMALRGLSTAGIAGMGSGLSVGAATFGDLGMGAVVGGGGASGAGAVFTGTGDEAAGTGGVDGLGGSGAGAGAGVAILASGLGAAGGIEGSGFSGALDLRLKNMADEKTGEQDLSQTVRRIASSECFGKPRYQGWWKVSAWRCRKRVRNWRVRMSLAEHPSLANIRNASWFCARNGDRFGRRGRGAAGGV